MRMAMITLAALLGALPGVLRAQQRIEGGRCATNVGATPEVRRTIVGCPALSSGVSTVGVNCLGGGRMRTTEVGLRTGMLAIERKSTRIEIPRMEPIAVYSFLEAIAIEEPDGELPRAQEPANEPAMERSLPVPAIR